MKTGQPTQLLFATTNPHKLEEVEAIFADAGIEVRGLHDVGKPLPEEPDESADTFAENARIKARAYARWSGTRCLADDSGLVVDALGGAPGVRSARYAGEGATREERDRANNRRLLEELARAAVPERERTARFVCAMCICEPDGTVSAESEGTFEGVITDAPRGENGFGYDPLLLLPAEGVTSAELSPAEKNARSHRGAAARAMVERLRGLAGRGTAARP